MSSGFLVCEDCGEYYKRQYDTVPDLTNKNCSFCGGKILYKTELDTNKKSNPDLIYGGKHAPKNKNGEKQHENNVDFPNLPLILIASLIIFGLLFFQEMIPRTLALIIAIIIVILVGAITKSPSMAPWNAGISVAIALFFSTIFMANITNFSIYTLIGLIMSVLFITVAGGALGSLLGILGWGITDYINKMRSNKNKI